MIPKLFISRATIELERAQRYRLFVSLLVLDLRFVRDLFGEKSAAHLREIEREACLSARVSDHVALLGGHYLCLLYPETSRQDAEAAARRLTGVIRRELGRHGDLSREQMVPLELVSYPDGAGAKTLPEFLEDLRERCPATTPGSVRDSC